MGFVMVVFSCTFPEEGSFVTLHVPCAMGWFMTDCFYASPTAPSTPPPLVHGQTPSFLR